MRLAAFTKSIVLYVDTISPSPRLTINRLSVYKTFFGGLISLIVHIITVLGIGYFGKELLYKSEPFSLDSAMEFPDLSFNVDSKDYYFFVGLEDKNYQYFADPSLFTVSAEKSGYKYIDGVQHQMREQIDISLCSKYFNSTSELGNDQAIIDLNRFYCLDQSKATIEGFYGAPIFSSININVYKCINSTENKNICKSEYDIDAALEGGIFNIQSQNHILQLSNYEQPVKKFYDDIYYPLNKDLSFLIFINLRTLEFLTDSGVILQDLNTLNYPYSTDPVVFYYQKRENIIAQVIIQGKPLGRKINRSYVKLQNILTQVGGFIKAISLFAQALVGYVANISFKADIMHHLVSRKQMLEFKAKNENSNASKIAIRNNFLSSDIKNEPTSHHLSMVPAKLNFKHRLSFYSTNKTYSCNEKFQDLLKLFLNKAKVSANIENRIYSALSVENILENAFLTEFLAKKLNAEEKILAELQYVSAFDHKLEIDSKETFLAEN